MGAATSVRSIVRRPIAWAAVAAVLVAAVASSAWLTRNDGADIDTTDFVTGNVRLWTFFETEPVQLTLGYEPVGDVLAPRAGTVTAIHMDEGRSSQPGFKIMTIDGRPVVSVVGTVPFDRPLSTGSEGDDVTRLQGLLKDEGFYEGERTGTFDEATDAAVRAWQEQHAFPVDGVFLPGDVSLGAWPAVTAPILVSIGDVVAAGEPVAGLAAPGLSGRITALPGEDIPELRPGMLLSWETGDAPLVQFDDGSWGIGPFHGSASDVGVWEAAVALRVHSNQLAVPTASIQRDGDGPYVEVVGTGDGMRRVAVQRGLSDGDYVQVTGDLQPGQTVVLAPAGK